MKTLLRRQAAVLAVLAVAVITLPVIIGAVEPKKTDPRQQRIKIPVPHSTLSPVLPTMNRNQSDKVFLEYADRLHYDEIPGLPQEECPQVLNGNVKLRKGGMWMYCDSAYFFEKTNSFDAFGNVKMQQGDTLFVYADELNYDGAQQLAVLFADPGKKVKLINRDVTLETDIFTYDLKTDIGYYNIGGTLTDKQNILTSVEGQYHPRTKQSYFDYDVHLESKSDKDKVIINTEALTYNTATNMAELNSPSEIINADGTIYTSSGIYNTNKGTANLFARSTVRTNKGNILIGDTLFYNRQKQYGEAFGNMVLIDTENQSEVLGDYGFYDEVRDSAFVTGHALAKEYSKGDTLYLHGDTIIAYLDLADSTRVTNAFHRVKFYRSDVQGLCDSLSLTERDSIMYMYRSPIVWSDKRQISGNIINVHMADSTVDWARLPQTGFIAELIAEDCYNQISGNDMTAWFADSVITRLYVEGNVMLNLFPMEKDSTYNKFAYVESSYMDAYFDRNQIKKVLFWPETTSKFTPLYLARRGSYFLPKFKWYEDIRPRTPGDIFVVEQEMIDLFKNAEPLRQPDLKRAAEKNQPNPDAPLPSPDITEPGEGNTPLRLDAGSLNQQRPAPPARRAPDNAAAEGSQSQPASRSARAVESTR